MKKVTANQDDEYLGELKRVSETVKAFGNYRDKPVS